MGLKNNIFDFINKYTPIDTDAIRQKLPFVHLLGHEKSYGKPNARNYDVMMQNYKSWVFACANKNATSVASNTPQAFKRIIKVGEEEELKRIYQHPFLDLINGVNPFSNRYELFVITILNMELTGNAYWWAPRNVLGIPTQLWNIPSNWIKVVPSPEKFIAGYVMRVPGKGEPVPFPEEEIIHFKYPNPEDLYYGAGPTWGAQYGIDLNNEVKQWGIHFFMNNAQPSGVLSTESNLTPDEYDRMTKMWDKRHKGKKNAGKMAILEGGLKYQQMGSKMKESGYKEINAEVRDEIMAMYGVPASKLGLVNDVNRANADANDYTYQKETIFPKLKLMEEKFNEKLAPLYDPNLVIRFDNPVPDDNDFRLREKESNIRTGITSIDEEREKDGLEPLNLPETSVPLIPFNVVPAGTPAPEPTSPEKVDAEKEKKSLSKSQADNKWRVFVTLTAPQERMLTEVVKRFFEKQHSEVMRSLNNFKSHKKDLFSSISFILDQAINELSVRSQNNVREAYVSGLELGSQEVGNQIDFNLFEPNIQLAVNERLRFFAEKVNQSTQALMERAIQAGIREGESIEEISKRIDTVFQHSEGFRAKTIAQTEVIGAVNSGQLKAYNEAGITEKKWLTARDEKVRDSHQIDGQIVKSGDVFNLASGAVLLYPGDRSTGADAGEVINCRCTVLPVTKKES